MKKTILLLLGTLFLTTIYAQNDSGGTNIKKINRLPEPKNSISNYISVDTIISFPSETDLRGLVSNQWGNTVMFTTFTTNCKSDTMRLYSINAETFGVDTILIYLENIRETIKHNQNIQISNIAFNNNYIVLHYFSHLIIYKKNNGQFVLHKESKTKEFSSMQFVNDSILALAENYYSHTPPTFISLFNINTLSVEKNIFPNFNNLLLSYFSPKKNFDAKDNTILWANRAEYSFSVFDNKLQLQDSISYPEKDWKKLSEKTLKKAHKRKKHDAADIIAIVEKEYFHIDQLQWAYIIDSNNIALIHSKPRKEGHMSYPVIDIWTKANEKWQISKSEIDDFAIRSDSVQRNSFAIDFLSGPEIHFVNNNKVVKLSKNGVLAKYPIGMAAQEYYQREWDAWQNNDQFLQITIFSHTFAK